MLVGNQARLEIFSNCRPAFASRQILFTGSPGPDHLFSEVVAAVAMVPDAQLAVAGREPDPAIWDRARSLLGSRLTHLGWLGRSDVARAMNASCIGLSTYADVPTNSSNSPNKLFECAAAGLPVVATPTPSNARYLAESGAGCVAQGFTSGDLAHAISQLLADEAAWKDPPPRGVSGLFAVDRGPSPKIDSSGFTRTSLGSAG